MKKLILITATFFIINIYALPQCPSDTAARWHNCFGTYTFADGEKYVGEFQDDKKHGQGTYTFANGDKYVGEHKDGQSHGQGTFTYGQNSEWAGDKYVGESQDGKRHGQGTYTFADGTEQTGFFLNGSFVPYLCQEMGLTRGTDAYGQCVIKLIDEVTK